MLTLHSESRIAGRVPERLRTVKWVCDLLRVELLSGAYFDSILPSEDALIAKYGVSRGIIRRVLLILREQGVIERIRGAGTFVLAPRVLDHGIDQSRDLAQEVNAEGTRVAIRKAHASIHPSTGFVANALEIPVGSDVVILESMSSLDGYPLSLRTAFMPASWFGVLVEDPRFDLNRSPYEIMEDVLGKPMGDTELQISSSAADPICAELLNVMVGSAMLDTTRIVRTTTGVPAEYSISHARGDRIVFSTVMRA